MNNFQIALELLLVGMTTVFFILMLVVLIGRTSITILNKFYPEKVIEAIETKPGLLTKNKMVAISTAINIATSGKAKVVKIERI